MPDCPAGNVGYRIPAELEPRVRSVLDRHRRDAALLRTVVLTYLDPVVPAGAPARADPHGEADARAR